MNSKELRHAVQNGIATLEMIRLELPEISKEEQKIIAFEVRAATMNAAVNGISAKIREELIPARRDQMAWINSMTRERSSDGLSIRRIHGREAENDYFGQQLERSLSEIALIEATMEALTAEKAKLQEEWKPVKVLAEGMRAEFTRRTQAAQREQVANYEPLEKPVEAIAAEMRYQGGPTDDLPRGAASSIDATGDSGRPLVTPGQVIAKAPAPTRAASASGGDWLTKLQDKAYGDRNGR